MWLPEQNPQNLIVFLSITAPLSSQPLSGRRRQVLRRLLQGQTPAQIAAALRCTEAAVRRARRSLLGRLGLGDVENLQRLPLPLLAQLQKLARQPPRRTKK